jgi:hypothetical protein
MKRFLTTFFAAAALCALFSSATFGQSGRWTHQIGIEVGPQYAFNGEAVAENGQRLLFQDVGLGFGAAINYYYKIERALFLSVSGVFGYFASGTGYFRRINADGTLPVLNTFYFNDFNPLINLALTAGFRYNFAVTGLQPYIGAEIGTYSIGGIPREDQSAPINLAATPKIGIRYPLAQGLDFDASAKLMWLFSGYIPFSYASVNVGVSYALNFENN